MTWVGRNELQDTLTVPDLDMPLLLVFINMYNCLYFLQYEQ